MITNIIFREKGINIVYCTVHTHSIPISNSITKRQFVSLIIYKDGAINFKALY